MQSADITAEELVKAAAVVGSSIRVWATLRAAAKA